jgi:hypothetical protein
MTWWHVPTLRVCCPTSCCHRRGGWAGRTVTHLDLRRQRSAGPAGSWPPAGRRAAFLWRGCKAHAAGRARQRQSPGKTEQQDTGESNTRPSCHPVSPYRALAQMGRWLLLCQATLLTCWTVLRAFPTWSKLLLPHPIPSCHVIPIWTSNSIKTL